MLRQRISATWVAGLLACLVGVAGGCHNSYQFAEPHRVPTSAEAGDAHIAVTSVGFWDDIAFRLQPDFKIENEAILRDALRTTIATDHRDVTSLVGSLRVAMQVPAATAAPAPTASGAASTTPPPAASSAPRPAGTATASESPKDVDAFTQYHLATAIHQEIAMLNHYVRMAAEREGHVPYLVRLNLAIMPRARNMPYDTFTDLTFSAGGAKCREDDARCARVVAVPILLTDVMERAAVSRSMASAVQLGLAVAATMSAAGVEADASWLKKTVAAVQGSDLNSLFTLAQKQPHVLEARVGARYQATSHYSLEAQNHMVTVLLLVPRDVADGDRHVNVRTRTEFVDAERGTVLPGASAHTFEFELPKHEPPCVYDKQIALVREDEKEANVTIIGRAFNSHPVMAWLEVPAEGGKTIQVRPLGRSPHPAKLRGSDEKFDITFPKLSRWHLYKPGMEVMLHLDVTTSAGERFEHGYASPEGCVQRAVLPGRYLSNEKAFSMVLADKIEPVALAFALDFKVAADDPVTVNLTPAIKNTRVTGEPKDMFTGGAPKFVVSKSGTVTVQLSKADLKDAKTLTVEAAVLGGASQKIELEMPKQENKK